MKITPKKKESQSRALASFDAERPLLSLREAMNRLFDESFWDPFSLVPQISRPLAQGLFPKIDVSETAKEVKVVANVPGIEPSNIEIEVDDESLTLSGEMERKEEEKGERYSYLEREYGSFCREILLPAKVKPDKVKAKVKNGVLTVILPKAKEETRKKIKVEVG